MYKTVACGREVEFYTHGRDPLLVALAMIAIMFFGVHGNRNRDCHCGGLVELFWGIS